MTYIGRFAPTPTGPLHMGSLVAALASYLDAKSQQGTWLLRIEDLDPPREDKAASTFIPQQLLAHGLQWDGEIEFQSNHQQRYETVLEQLRSKGHLFPCACSRKSLSASHGLHHGKCPTPNSDQPAAMRLLVADKTKGFEDAVYGQYQQALSEVGDQILKRKDDLYAYQLAVVVDDYYSGINHVVRGVDLLDNTPRQLYIMDCLGYPHPSYLHLPLIINDDGQKLSKQNQAKALDLSTPKENLLFALGFLKQPTPADQSSLDSILNFAIKHLNASQIKASFDGVI